MSYARMGEFEPEGYSGVYVYESVAGWACAICSVKDKTHLDPVFTDLRKLVKHLRAHSDAGYNVPKRALWAIIDDFMDGRIEYREPTDGPEVQEPSGPLTGEFDPRYLKYEKKSGTP
jgi:hypothetical protein